MNKSLNLNPKELKVLTEYFSWEVAIPYLQDESSIKSFLETQKTDILASDFPSYFANLKKEAEALIKINPIAKEIYFRLNGQDLIKTQINDLISYKEKILRARFKETLVSVYNSSTKAGFSLSTANNIRVYLEKKGHVRINNNSSLSPDFCLGHSHLFNKVLVAPTYIGEEGFTNFSHNLDWLFDKYWEKMIILQNNPAKEEFKAILSLENKINLFLSQQNDSLKEIFY